MAGPYERKSMPDGDSTKINIETPAPSVEPPTQGTDGNPPVGAEGSAHTDTSGAASGTEGASEGGNS